MEVALFDMVALQIFTLFSTIIAMRLLRGSFALGKSFGFGIVQHTTSRTKMENGQKSDAATRIGAHSPEISRKSPKLYQYLVPVCT